MGDWNSLVNSLHTLIESLKNEELTIIELEEP